MDDSLKDRALEALLGDSMAHVVDMVLVPRGRVVEAHSQSGAVGFTRTGPDWVRGRNPLEHQDPAALCPLEVELRAGHPTNRVNHYPHAYERAAQIFDDPRAPDLAVIHSAAHNWQERGGHRGEHGSLDVVQSRAPLILAGRGVRRLGHVAAHARMVDIAPTLATLAGVTPLDGRMMMAQDGRALDEALDDSDRPARVVAFLLDGTNANVLYAMVSAGELPAVARLMEEGTVFDHGVMASFPSSTLANHTTALTGVHPGHHSVLHNAYFDRATARQILTNAPEAWHLARDKIAPWVETVFEAVVRSGAGFTACVNEPSDRGAHWSTFDLRRSGLVTNLGGALPNALGVPRATAAFVDAEQDYAWATAIDHLAVAQAVQLWTGWGGNPRPRFMWVNLILPDAGNHAGGPHSDIGHAALRDTDARLGDILDGLDWGGGETAFVVLADHGMEQTDPECKGDYGEVLDRAGIRFRDEAFGFIYLNP